MFFLYALGSVKLYGLFGALFMLFSLRSPSGGVAEYSLNMKLNKFKNF